MLISMIFSKKMWQNANVVLMLTRIAINPDVDEVGITMKRSYRLGYKQSVIYNLYER